MKKYLAVVLVVVLLLCMVGCQASRRDQVDSGIAGNAGDEPGWNKAPEGGETTPQTDCGVQYIRTNGYRDGEPFPKVTVIHSLQELNSYYEANKDQFYLERNPKPAADTTIGFLDACDKYDNEYFKDGFLVFVLLEEGSGSVRHHVEKAAVSPDGELSVYIKTITPEVGTCDMAQWHIILEITDTLTVKGEGSVQVYLDGRLAYDKGTTVSQEIGTQAPVIFHKPPEAKLLHGDGSTPLQNAGCNWNYPESDGTMGAIIADHAHALDCQEFLEPISVESDYVKLAFEDDPDSVEVLCWPDSAWGKPKTPPETVTCDGAAFDLKNGGYIYEIIGKWDENETAHFGSVSYYVYIVSGVE